MKRSALVLVSCLLLVGCGQRTESADDAGVPLTSTSPAPTSGKWTVSQFPDVALHTWDSQSLTQFSMVHKPVVVNLWASWCSNCAKEMPFIATSKYAKNVVAINVNDVTVTPASKAPAQKLVDTVNNAFPIYVDQNNELLSALKVSGLPVTFAVNSKGTIVDFELGGLTESSLARLVTSSQSQ